MKSRCRFPSLLLRTLATAVLGLFMTVPCRADAPGGFLEYDETSMVRPYLTASQIASFMPATRGSFTFPAPWNTQGVRITQSSDCGGQDCVDDIYNYWKNMSNSTGSNTLYVFIGLDRHRGGAGPTLFSYDKTTGAVTDMGPLFGSSDIRSWYTGEGMYFSYSMPTKIYFPSGSQFQRYDVLTHTTEIIFDTNTQYPNTVLYDMSSSNDDNVHVGTLENGSTYAMLGCVVYRVNTKQFSFYPMVGVLHKCQIDKSGRYLIMKETTPQTCSSCDLDDMIVDLQTGVQTYFPQQDGGGAHSDTGYGWYVSQDTWAKVPSALRLWNLSQPMVEGAPIPGTNLVQGGLIYHNLVWGVFTPEHVSWENASPLTPVSQQYVCGGGENAATGPHGNEIMCISLSNDTAPINAEQVLVVAPTMTDPNASGGSGACPDCLDYAHQPKGNTDPTGQYFFWVSNLASNRMDAFIVKIPYQLLGGIPSGNPPPPPAPSPSPSGSPQVAITTPTNDTTVSGSVTVAASVSDSQSISSVTFELDGGARAVTLNQPPYSVSWDTSDTSPGTHVITAIATDASGNSGSSSPITVYVAGGSSQGGGNGGTSPSRPHLPGGGDSGPPSAPPSPGGGGGASSVFMLLVLCLLSRERRGHRLHAPP